MKSKKLILWDIDATLVKTLGAGIYALLKAASELFEIKAEMDGIPCAGRTDVTISTDLLNKYGIEPTKQNIEKLLQAYFKELPSQLPKFDGKILPGVSEILEWSKEQENIYTGLLTGNHSTGAKIKLSHFNLWDYFPFGAFADDSPIRNELGPIALKKAHHLYGIHFPPRDVYVIGDTPHDIACAKVISANSIAVATNGYTCEQLASHQPTALWEDLGNTKEFFDFIENDQVPQNAAA